AVELGVVLVRAAAEERLDVQAVLPDDEPRHGGELVLPRELDEERVLTRFLELQLRGLQRLPDRLGRIHPSPPVWFTLTAPRARRPARLEWTWLRYTPRGGRRRSRPTR